MRISLVRSPVKILHQIKGVKWRFVTDNTENNPNNPSKSNLPVHTSNEINKKCDMVLKWGSRETGTHTQKKQLPAGFWRIHIWHSSSWRGICCRCSWTPAPEPPARALPDSVLRRDQRWVIPKILTCSSIIFLSNNKNTNIVTFSGLKGSFNSGVKHKSMTLFLFWVRCYV